MTITVKQIKAVAQLARLHIDEEMIPEYAKTLSRILDFIDKINTYDTKDTAPLAHPLDVTQRFREDQITETNQREIMQEAAPETEAGLYLVPEVIERES